MSCLLSTCHFHLPRCSGQRALRRPGRRAARWRPGSAPAPAALCMFPLRGNYCVLQHSNVCCTWVNTNTDLKNDQ